MKNILLTTTALVAFAGAAAADGHASITWGGAATAGVARDGGEAGITAGGTALVQDLIDAFDADTPVDADELVAFMIARSGETPEGDSLEEIGAALRAALAKDRLDLDAALATNFITAKAHATEVKKLAAVSATVDKIFGTADDATTEWDTYAEVNLTATGSVDLGNGVTVSGAISVDAGTGYDFADDDGFDAPKSNGVSLDYIKVDGGAMGALTFDKDDIAHLVDGDDDANGDISYTNAFGNATVAFVMDMSTDTDKAPSAASWMFSDDETDANAIAFYDRNDNVNASSAAVFDIGEDGGEDVLVYNPAVAADVQWSVKLGYTVSDSMSVYAAFDEEQGNAFGGSYSMNGMTVSVDSKLEALEAALEKDRSNTIAGSYSVAGFTAGASYNTIEDGNQWGVNAAYAVDGMSVAYNTNEGEEWTATASYALNDMASVSAGVNYTEDAYVGVSFKF